jgi:hypothetical protein
MGLDDGVVRVECCLLSDHAEQFDVTVAACYGLAPSVADRGVDEVLFGDTPPIGQDLHEDLTRADDLRVTWHHGVLELPLDVRRDDAHVVGRYSDASGRRADREGYVSSAA